VLALILLLGIPGFAQAQLSVVATTESMGMLARVVGGEQVRVTVLAPPDRDAHDLVARPSMMAALRRADLLLAVGSGLEEGWLPAAVRGAANPRIDPGRRGYLAATDQVDLIGTGVAADRALGHVHPEGNPHLQLDPLRMAQVAQALARRLGELTDAPQEQFLERAGDFDRQVSARLEDWRALVRDAPGMLAYHEDVDYLSEWLGIRILGYIEPLPGVPPTASHLRSLAQRLSGTEGVIVHANYQPARGPQFMGETLGWPVYAMPMEPPAGADGGQYLDMLDLWVRTLARQRD